MKPTLRDELISIRKRLLDRITDLELYETDYKEADNYIGAENAKIKRMSFDIVLSDIDRILSK